MQAAFAAALCDASLPPPGFDARRFAVYRNNRMVALTGALAAGFPATQRIVGEDYFAAMARAFIRRYPPRSPVLLCYGGELPDFITAFEPSLPYLGDVARIEAAWTRAYHAPDAASLAPHALGQIAQDKIAGLRLTLHPSLSIIRSAHPAATIWEMNADGAVPHEIENWAGEDVLIARPSLDVIVHRLPKGAAAFLQSLQRGETLSQAAEAAFAENPDFDLARQLAAIFATGLATQEISS